MSHKPPMNHPLRLTASSCVGNRASLLEQDDAFGNEVDPVESLRAQSLPTSILAPVLNRYRRTDDDTRYSDCASGTDCDVHPPLHAAQRTGGAR